MKSFPRIFGLMFVLILGFGLLGWQTADAQTNPLTYPEIITALNTKLPNSVFKDKSQLINWLMTQIQERKVEKPLSTETEGILRQSGATNELISVIKANPPNSAKTVQSQTLAKNYSEMSEIEKRQFIETKANGFLDRFGRTATDKISVQGLNLIKESIDGYLKRLSVDEKTIGNNDGMVSKNTCNFARGNLTNVLKRGTEYSSTIKESFENIGVQPEIGIYIAFIETEFCPCLQAPTGPLGMFQLTYMMATNYGLQAKKGATPDSPDARCNPKSASQAAASYFKLLTDKYYGKDVNGILFSVAAFNSGEGYLNRNIKTVRETGKTNVTFWDLVENKNKLIPQFQNENYRYAPKFLAAAIIGENPKSFGLVEFQPLSPSSGKQLSSPNSQKQTLAVNEEAEFWKKQKDKALEPRNQPTGLDIEGLIIPEELYNFDKQTKALEEMKKQGYVSPMDFFDLAERSLNKELVEVPYVTKTYFLEIGGNATDSPFTKFTFQDGATIPAADSVEFKKLKQSADNFDGQKFDLNNPKDRKEVRIRLLQMINPKVKAVIEEIAQKYQAKFGRPLRVTSLVRPIDYQIDLSKVNANAFLVKPGGGIPPHCSGLAFDFAYKHLTAEEQNFLLGILAEIEKEGRIDALRESGVNAVIHVFVL